MNKFYFKVPKQLQGAFSFPKQALEIHKLISSKFPQTFFVGGAVRNALLKKKITDIDIATIATPKQIVSLLKQNKISFSSAHEKFGIVIATIGGIKIEIATFRKDTYKDSRYPQINFVKTVEKDSVRRDFTINALYYSPQTKEIFDFHNGLLDAKKGLLRFIGNAEERIIEDPLRILRAYRFQLQYGLKFEKETATALKKNLQLLKKLSATRVQREINSHTTKKLQKQLQKVIHNLY